jgi:hypothetical protein
LEGRLRNRQKLPLISDGVILRVLRNLLILHGERFSYLIKSIGHDGDAKVVWRELIRQPSVLQPPLHHLAHRVSPLSRRSQELAFSVGGAEEGSLGFLGDTGGDVFIESGHP